MNAKQLAVINRAYERARSNPNAVAMARHLANELRRAGQFSATERADTAAELHSRGRKLDHRGHGAVRPRT